MVPKNTTLDINLLSTQESCTTLPSLRTPTTFPAETFRLALKDIASGRAEHLISSERFVDRVSLRFLNPQGPLDQSFRYADASPPDHGDYYYVHVRQIDGAEAWSSPIWVGGFSSK